MVANRLSRIMMHFGTFALVVLGLATVGSGAEGDKKPRIKKLGRGRQDVLARAGA